jgi:hypothetical protein
MKKSAIQKKIIVRQNEQDWLSFLQDKFIMVSYSDLQLVPNQALLLGYIRGMITTNQKSKRAVMKKMDRFWMKDSMKKMAYLIGVSESTIKDYISILLKKGYINQGNYSNYHDNTNWYSINQHVIDSDFNAYLDKQKEVLKTLELELEIDKEIIESIELMVEFNDCTSQNSPIDSLETTETLLYNIIDTSYNKIEPNIICLNTNDLNEFSNMEEQYAKIKDVEDINIHLEVLKSFNFDKIPTRVKYLFLNRFLDQSIENIKSIDDLTKSYHRLKARLRFHFELSSDDIDYCLRLFDLYYKQTS